jgi:hypothetical protein
MDVGRPTKYKQEYCISIVEHMAKGNSFESFAGRVGVCFDTLYHWTHQYPEFSEAKKVGLAKLLLFDEDLGKAGVAGQLKRMVRKTTDKDGKVTEEYEAATFGQTFHIFTLKNRYPRMYRDKIQVETSFGEDAKKTNKVLQEVMADPILAEAARKIAEKLSEE